MFTISINNLLDEVCTDTLESSRQGIIMPNKMEDNRQGVVLVGHRSVRISGGHLLQLQICRNYNKL